MNKLHKLMCCYKRLWSLGMQGSASMLLTMALIGAVANTTAYAQGSNSGGGGSNSGGGGSNSGGGGSNSGDSNASKGSLSGDGFSRTKDRSSGSSGLSRGSNSSGRAPTYRASADRNDRIRAYIRDNYARIEEDAARGGGEYLNQLAAIADIPNKYQDDFYAAVKRDYQTIFTDIERAEDVLVRYCDRYRRGIGVSAKQPNKPNPKPTVQDVKSVSY